MGLNDYSGGEDSDGGPKKTTYFQFQNPSHPEAKEFADPEKAQRHYDAAMFLQNQLGSDRNNVIGEFASAIEQLEKNDNEEPLQQLVQQLRE